MTQDDLKNAAAQAALEYVEDNMIVGVGTGTTVNYFIEVLATVKHRIETTVASSLATESLLKAHHIPVSDLNSVPEVAIYVDGADEVNSYLQMIKGGGGALTQEKIIAQAAKKFICIADESKQVKALGEFPVPLEVIPSARSLVAREIVALGGMPVYREDFVTDNGNIILDVHHLNLNEPVKMEERLNQIVGIVTNGIFARRPADCLLLATDKGVNKVML